ncbi:MAG: Dps family protein [Candidatus Nanopelagicales bacterium]
MANTVDVATKPADREKIATALSQFLADSYTLYLKTHNYHWNVTGPQFGALHTMFENQYLDLADAVDLVAERIRALGVHAPGSYREFSAATTIIEGEAGVPAMEMIKQLAQDNQTVARSAAAVIAVADEADDQPTVDIATTRQEVHEKNAWMLRSYLE